MVENFTLAWSWVIAWNSSWSARFWSDSRWNTVSHGSFMFSPSRMVRRYFPKTVTTATVACGTLRNQENAKNTKTTNAMNRNGSMILPPLSPQPRRAGLHHRRQRLQPGGVLAARRGGVLVHLLRHGVELVDGPLRRPVLLGFVQRGLDRRRPGGRDALAAVQLIQIGARDDHVRGPGHLRLFLRVELVHADERGRVDLVLGKVLARQQLENVETTRDLGRVDTAVVPVCRPVAPDDQIGGVERTAIEVPDLDRVGRVGEVEHRQAALVPRLDHDVAARHGDERSVVRDAVLLLGLRDRTLEVAAELKLLVDNVEDGVGAPGELIRRAAARRGAAPPLVGEDHFGAVVVERRRVPVREVLVRHRIEADGGHRLRDLEQDAVARTAAPPHPARSLH